VTAHRRRLNSGRAGRMSNQGLRVARVEASLVTFIEQSARDTPSSAARVNLAERVTPRSGDGARVGLDGCAASPGRSLARPR
jgi:hypothetical protein